MYDVIDLGVLPGATPITPTATAIKVNDAGTVIGYANVSSGAEGFLWSLATGMKSFSAIGAPGLVPSDINNLDQIVGEKGNNLAIDRAFIFDFRTAQLSELNTPPGTTSSGSPYGINDAGLVTGSVFSQIGGGQYAPFLWTPAGGQYLACPPGYHDCEGSDINSLGLVLAFGFENGVGRAFIQNPTTGQNQYLDPQRAWEISPRAINTSEYVTGFAVPIANTMPLADQGAFLWTPNLGEPASLGGLRTAPYVLGTYSEGKDINNFGTVVGAASTDDFNITHAFIFTGGLPDGSMVDLNHLIPLNSGWVLGSANGISNKGWIVGSGEHNGQTRAFLLQPKRAKGGFQKIVAEVWEILFGIRFGEGGIQIGLDGRPHRIGPGPDPDPIRRGLSPQMQHMVVATALNELAHQEADAHVQRELKHLANNLAKEAKAQ